MIKYKNSIHIADINFKNCDITIEYTYTESELDYFNGTGTYEHTSIEKIYIDNVDITGLMSPHLRDLENITLELHTNK
tara:strand:+ start:381 stop:614 length:234 start_codon:yes stop_codon:yes gene_type:complete